MTALLASLQRDLTILLRKPIMFINPLLFLLISASLFPLAISPESTILKPLAAGIIWVLVLLAMLLSLQNLLDDDFDNGMLEQIVISQVATVNIIVSKILAHFIITGVPIILLSPLIGKLLFMDFNQIKILLFTLILATPTLSLIGVIGAVLTASLKNSVILLFIIVLPLYIPILIFASATVYNSTAGLDVSGSLYFLATMLVLMMMLSPLISSYALKISME